MLLFKNEQRAESQNSRVFIPNVSPGEESRRFAIVCIDSGFIASLRKSWIVCCCT